MDPSGEVIVFGAGDLALEVLKTLDDLNRKITQEGFLYKRIVSDIISNTGAVSDDVGALLGDSSVVHNDWTSVENLSAKELIICVGDPTARERILNEVRDLPVRPQLLTLIHPTAYVASGATIGGGAIVAPFAYIGPGAVVGENVLVNVHASVGHHVVVGRSSVVSPQVALNGRARLERAVFIGAGAVIAPRSYIGAFSKISNGTVFSGSCGDGFLFAGNPAKGRQMFRIPEKNI